MATFTLRRLLAIPPLLFGVALMTFILLRNAPGDFFTQMEMNPTVQHDTVVNQRLDAGLIRRISPEALIDLGAFTHGGHTWEFLGVGNVHKNGAPIESRLAARELKRFTVGGREYQSDESGQVYVRVGSIEGFIRWIGKVVNGDFGMSFQKKLPVIDLIIERMGNTLTLSVSALLLAWLSAIPLGVLAAVKPNSFWDHSCGFIAFFGLSIPSVFFALLMVLLASYTGWFPIGDMRDLDYDSLSPFGKLWDRIHHLILPTIVIGTGAMAGYMRQARGNMIEALGQDYVRTARAKGLPRKTVLFKHALRNAINPLVTLFGYSLAALLSGSFLVEVVMNWPGMARLVVDAIFSKDEPVVMASVLFSAMLLVFGNLIADLLLGVVDPRVRLS